MKKNQPVNKNNNQSKSNLTLVLALVICLLVLAVLIVCVVQKFTPDDNTDPAIQDDTLYIELPVTKGMGLGEAKELLDMADISYEVISTESKIPNRIENIEYVGKIEGGKTLVEVGTSVKLHANEVGVDKIVYLTFDDGPTQDNTDAILDMLDDYGIKATFFVEGYDVHRFPEKMKETYRRGHLIGCHSYSHQYENIYSSTDDFLSEIEQYEDALKSAIGNEAFHSMPKVLRFPGGTNNYLLGTAEALEYISAIRGEGYGVYDWTALTNDADDRYRLEGESDSEYFVRSLREGLESAKNKQQHLIVLMHDKMTMRDALGDVLDYLVSEGYYFDTIDNCPEYTFVE